MYRLKIVIEPATKKIFSRCVSDYKSPYSLDKVYPHSSLNITKPVEPPPNTNDTFSGYIPMDQIQFKHISGKEKCPPYRNKVFARTEIRFKIDSASWIPDDIRKKMLNVYGNRTDKDGNLVVWSEKARTHTLNQADCLDKLRRMIWEVNSAPSMETESVESHENKVREKLQISKIAAVETKEETPKDPKKKEKKKKKKQE